MTAYLVRLPTDRPGIPVFDGNAMVVSASSEADALAVADGHYAGDARGLFTTIGSAVAIEEASNFDGYEAHVALINASPVVDVVSTGVLGINPEFIVGAGITIEDGGTGYAIDDIVTLTDGSTNVSIRPATFRVITVSTGVVTALEVMDPGDYTTLSDDGDPTPLATTNDGSGDNDLALSFDTGFATSTEYENILAGIVTALNATSSISGASLDASEGASGARELVIAAAGDGLGDRTVLAEIRKNGSAVAGLVGTITDAGSSGDAITAALPAIDDVSAPQVIAVLRAT